MLKIAMLTGALTIGLIGGSYAQSTGPAAQPDNMNKPAMTNTNSDTVKKSNATGASSTGMSSGGGSGTATTGSANGSPAAMPKTTTGPTGAASKDESPPK
ncbi:MAG: hypothetical protein QOE55_1266 [Acidobacteriaceae bacterium]|nr:hypothetical protein [Acidobacteriaceae bacterium]